MARTWDILIIGGASGSGKTSISRPLSRLYGVDLVRVDDFQILLETLTPETLPAINYWRTHTNLRDEESIDMTVSKMVDTGLVFMLGLSAIIKDHLLENIPMILEGDFIHPELSTSFNNSRVKTIFIHEFSQEQISQNYFIREGKHQAHRASISYAYGIWLKETCKKHHIPVIESRPWDNLVERVIVCLSEDD